MRKTFLKQVALAGSLSVAALTANCGVDSRGPGSTSSGATAGLAPSAGNGGNLAGATQGGASFGAAGTETDAGVMSGSGGMSSGASGDSQPDASVDAEAGASEAGDGGVSNTGGSAAGSSAGHTAGSSASGGVGGSSGVGGSGGTSGASGASSGGRAGNGGAPQDAGSELDCSPGDYDAGALDGGIGTKEHVQGIVSGLCVYCHSGKAAPEGLDLSDIGAVVAQPSVECSTKLRIKAGSAKDSYLVDKLIGAAQSPCTCFVGQRMPLDDDAVSDDQLHSIESWINAGAPN